MKTDVVTARDQFEQYYVLQINGKTKSEHHQFRDALKAGLELKRQFPQSDIKLREADGP